MNKDCNSKVAKHIEELPKSGIREFFDIVSTMKNVISLGVGEPDFVTPWHICEKGINSLKDGITGYTSNLGMLPLREEICKYVNNNFNVQYNPEEECLVTVGVSEGLDLAIRAIVNPGDEIIYNEPTFVSYGPEIAMSHGVPVPLVTTFEDKFALNPDKLRELITPKTKALLMSFPCNPTGAVLTLDILKEIAQIAIENDLIVITDEIYSELLYQGEHHSIAAMPGMRERTIFLHGFSKAFAMTGWRLGYACGPADIIGAMMKIHQYAIMSVNTTSQYAALEALRNGKVAAEKMRDSYKERRDIIVDSLNKMGLSCHLPNGAFYVFPSIKSSGMTSLDFATELLKEEEVAVIPGNAFGSCGEGFIRCCYATDKEEIIEAMRRIERFLKRRGKC